jgi:hypothetical protein
MHASTADWRAVKVWLDRGMVMDWLVALFLRPVRAVYTVCSHHHDVGGVDSLFLSAISYPHLNGERNEVLIDVI